MNLSLYINNKNYLFIVIVVFTLIITLLNVKIFDIFIYVLYLAICCVSIYGMLFTDKYSISVNKTFHLFNYFFLGIAPLIQFQNRVSFHGYKELDVSVFLKLGFIILISQVFYIFGYLYLAKKLTNSKLTSISNTSHHFKNKNSLFLVLSFLSFLVFFWLIDFDLLRVLYSPLYGWRKNSVKYDLLGYSLFLVVRHIPVILYWHFELSNKSNKNVLIKIFLLLMLVLTNFPSSITRSMLGSYYLPIIFLNFSLFRKEYYYLIGFLLSFFVLFPILNFFRNGKNTIELGVDLFVSPHMDAFYNFGVLYSEKVITYGKQFLGSSLFFIPETLWPNRPVGTGQMIAEKMNFNYTNIAFPFLGEGYANFGLLGVFISVVILVFINCLLDDISSKEYHNNFHWLKVLFLFFLGFEFYLLRGDLYSSFKLGISFLIALFFVIFIQKIFRRFMN